jgi:putrescine transport system substrate-binding protein
LAKLQDCRVYWLDAPEDMFAVALNYMGKDPNSKSVADYKAAADMMSAARPFVRKFHSSQYINDLANGEICLVVGWSGDVFQARNRAAEAKNGNEIAYFIPKEGALMWFDTMGIPKDAAHVENAHKFLDYILEAKVIAAVTNVVQYPNGNAAATEFVDEAIRTDKSVYPDEATKAKLFPNAVNTPAYDRLTTRAWTRIKTNQ